MKIKITLLFIVLSVSVSFAQFSARAGMAIDFVSTPSLNDYLLTSGLTSPDNQLNTFNSAVRFNGEGDYQVNDTYQIGLDFGYRYYSYTAILIGKYEFAYGVYSPTVMNYYVISGSGYQFKFGGGIGLRFTQASESFPGTGITTNYSSLGFGLMLRADGNTLLAGNFYANIGADVMYDFNGKPKNGGKYIHNNAYNENVNLNSFGAGVRLGVTYFF